MIIGRLFGTATILAALLWTGTAFAACYSAGACTCATDLTSISFGTYDRLSAGPNDTVGNLSVSCLSSSSAASSFTVALSPGSSGTSNSRTLRKGTNVLNYNLFIDAARTAVWGDGTGVGQTVTANFPAAGRSATMFNIYGRILALQNVPAGVYRDTITVTVTY